jgi:hypothetical protein
MWSFSFETRLSKQYGLKNTPAIIGVGRQLKEKDGHTMDIKLSEEFNLRGWTSTDLGLKYSSKGQKYTNNLYWTSEWALRLRNRIYKKALPQYNYIFKIGLGYTLNKNSRIEAKIDFNDDVLSNAFFDVGYTFEIEQKTKLKPKRQTKCPTY